MPIDRTVRALAGCTNFSEIECDCLICIVNPFQLLKKVF